MPGTAELGFPAASALGAQLLVPGASGAGDTHGEGGQSEWTLPVNVGLNLTLKKTFSGLLITPSFRSLRRTGPFSQAPVRYQQDLRNPGVSCVGRGEAGRGQRFALKVRKETGPNAPCISSQQPLADGQLPPGSASRSHKGTSCWRAPPKPLPSRPGQCTGCAGLPFPRRVKTPTQHKSHIKAASTCQKKKTEPNWTQTQIKERHTHCEGPRAPAGLWLPGMIHSCVI